LQFADDSGKHVEAVRDCLQTSLKELDDLVWAPGSFIVYKQVGKHENPQVLVRLGQTALRNITEFKYLGIIFDRKLTWRLHTEYIQRRCHARINFMESIEGQSWGAHPACLVVLYKITVRSVIEYEGVCFSGMSDCHMRVLELIQWRAWTNLLWSNEIYSFAVCGGLNESLPGKTEAFVQKQGVPGFGFG
jgi:hypothetical protein